MPRYIFLLLQDRFSLVHFKISVFYEFKSLTNKPQ
jgi:hypothetical protein